MKFPGFHLALKEFYLFLGLTSLAVLGELGYRGHGLLGIKFGTSRVQDKCTTSLCSLFAPKNLSLIESSERHWVWRGGLVFVCMWWGSEEMSVCEGGHW